MTPLSQTILEKYQVRKTKKQKLSFIQFMQEHFPDLQVQKGGLIPCRNIIIGDVEKAKCVLTAHYDTCSVLPVPNFITPKRPVLTILYSFLLVLPIFVLVMALNLMLNHFANNYLLHCFISMAAYFAILAVFVIGPPNKHTANDNTSGVITLCELLTSLSPEDRESVAFVFFDHEETGLIGSYLFRKRYKKIMQDKLLINFDCVSDGDHILMAATDSAFKKYGTVFEESFLPTGSKSILFEKLEKVYYPSDHAGFPCAMAAAALKYRPVIGYYMDRIHTNRDILFDEDNITLLCDGVCNLLDKL